MTQEALKLALECAERCEEIDGMYSWSATITAIKEALAQEQEPQIAFNAEVVGYVAPQRTWVGLTDEEKNGKRVLENGLLFNAAEVQAWELGVEYAEAKLKEANA